MPVKSSIPIPSIRLTLPLGTVGFDRDIFSGNPSLNDLKKYDLKLSPEEKSFLDNEVNELCEILDDYSVTENRDFPQEFWDRCKEQGFFGMIIPKHYGGKVMTIDIQSCNILTSTRRDFQLMAILK